MASTKSPGGPEVGRVSIKVVPDTSKFRQELRRQLAKEGKGLKVEIPVTFNTRGATKNLAALQRRLRSMTAQIGAQNFSLGSVVKDVDKLGDSVGKTADSFSSMNRIMLIGVGIALILAPALSLIATLIAGLPSLLFIAAGAFTAIALGMEGIKKAASVLAPQVDRLKKSLSATFERTLTPIFEKLIPLFDVLDAGLNKIAESLSTVFGAFVDVVTSSKGMAQVATILDGVAQFFSDIEPFVTTFTDAILTLGAEGAKSFDVLAVAFNRFGSDFNNIVQELAADGTLREAFVGLADVTNSLLSAFNRLFEIGVRLMGQMAGPITVLFDGFTDVLIALLPILADISTLVFNVLGTAFRALAPILTALQPLIRTLANFLQTVLLKAIEVLAPFLERLAQLLSDVLVQALNDLMPVMEPFIEFLAAIATMLGEFILAALQALTPLFKTFVQFLVDLFTAMQPLLPVLQEFVKTYLASILDILMKLAPEFVKIAQDILPKFLEAFVDALPSIIDFFQAMTDLLPVITDFIKLLLDGAIPVIRWLLETVATTWPAISDIISGALDFITGLIKSFIGLVTGDIDLFNEGVQQTFEGLFTNLKGVVETGLRAITGMFGLMPEDIIKAFGDFHNLLFGAGKSIIEGLGRGIRAAAGAVADAARSVVQKIRNLFPFSPAKEGPFSGQGYTLYSGRALMEDWARGIEQGKNAALMAVDDVMSATSGQMEMSAAVESDGFTGIAAAVNDALSQWDVVIDANGVAKMVNRVNHSNERR